MVAALLSVGILNRLEVNGLDANGLVAIELPRFLLLFLLVDVLWGSIWGAMVLPNSLPNLTNSQKANQVWLPYLRSGSPAARLFGTDSPGILSSISRLTLPSVALALLVAATLHPDLFWLTLGVVVLSVGGWLYRQVDVVPIALLYSIVAVAFPWWAALLVSGHPPGVAWRYPAALAILWTVHIWGGNRSIAEPGDRFGLAGIAVAQAGISLLLILLQIPLWLALLAILWLPTWLAVYQKRSLRAVEFWWLAAMIVSSLALGQIG